MKRAIGPNVPPLPTGLSYAQSPKSSTLVPTAGTGDETVEHQRAASDASPRRLE